MNAATDFQIYDNFVVTQSPLDCSTSLSAATPAPSNPTFAYDAVTTTETIGGWSLFVANDEPTNCALFNCYLREAGCVTSYTAG